jgi:hypothetical protein
MGRPAYILLRLEICWCRALPWDRLVDPVIDIPAKRRPCNLSTFRISGRSLLGEFLIWWRAREDAGKYRCRIEEGLRSFNS